MQTHREEEEVAGLRGKSSEIVRDGLAIRPVIIEGEARESESWGSSPLIVSLSEEETGFDKEFAEDFMQGLRLETIAQEHEEEEEEEEEEFEFAFVCKNPDGSLISAEEAFQDGRIKPLYPVFGRNIFLDEDASQSSSSSSSSSVLRGIPVEERVGNSSSSSSSSLDGGDPLEGLAEGTYCVWRMGRAGQAGEGVKGVCRKSNSTGFSKLWRVKELVMRSNSDGKDAFVFLNPKKSTATTTIAAAQTKSAAKSNGGKIKAVTVAVRKNGHHGFQVRSDKNRRRTYLPYKVGFFTNMNGMSRNVHPY